MNASRMAAAKARSHCHELREQHAIAGDYDLDYSQDSLGEAEDPCEEAVKQAKQVALLTAAAKKESEDAQAAERLAEQQPAGELCSKCLDPACKPMLQPSASSASACNLPGYYQRTHTMQLI